MIFQTIFKKYSRFIRVIRGLLLFQRPLSKGKGWGWGLQRASFDTFYNYCCIETPPLTPPLWEMGGETRNRWIDYLLKILENRLIYTKYRVPLFTKCVFIASIG